MPAKKQTIVTVAAWFMSLLLVAGVSFTFKLAYGTHENQAAHNIDMEAHPTIKGQLTMIEDDVGDLSDEVSKNSDILGEVRDEQLAQGFILRQIQKTVNGDPR